MAADLFLKAGIWWNLYFKPMAGQSVIKRSCRGPYKQTARAAAPLSLWKPIWVDARNAGEFTPSLQCHQLRLIFNLPGRTIACLVSGGCGTAGLRVMGQCRNCHSRAAVYFRTGMAGLGKVEKSTCWSCLYSRAASFFSAAALFSADRSCSLPRILASRLRLSSIFL